MDPINKHTLRSPEEEIIDVSFAVRSDGMFVILFSKPMASVNFNPVSAMHLKQALDTYLNTRILGT